MILYFLSVASYLVVAIVIVVATAIVVVIVVYQYQVPSSLSPSCFVHPIAKADVFRHFTDIHLLFFLIFWFIAVKSLMKI